MSNKGNYRHGGKGTPEYAAWRSMKRRCYAPNCSQYHNYGGRGIEVCPEWKDSFIQFREDMGLKPSPKHSLDRIDTDGNYSPDNCRWATAQEQMANVRYNRKLTFQGRTLCLAEWSREVGIKDATIRKRLDIHGYTVEEALTIKVREYR